MLEKESLDSTEMNLAQKRKHQEHLSVLEQENSSLIGCKMNKMRKLRNIIDSVEKQTSSSNQESQNMLNTNNPS
ncbi:MAG: hypothetical protein AB8U30_06235 [Rickettsiales endosymbiont of Dermacentor nuttalli]